MKTYTISICKTYTISMNKTYLGGGCGCEYRCGCGRGCFGGSSNSKGGSWRRGCHGTSRHKYGSSRGCAGGRAGLACGRL